MRRIAKGIMRYVVNSADPFIVNTRNGERAGQQPRVRGIDEPMWTITAQGSQGALVAPFLTEHANASNQRVMAADSPLRTQMAQVKGGHFALVSAFIAKHYGDSGQRPGSEASEPLSTITTSDHNGLVTASLVHMGHGEQSSTGARRWSHGVRNIEQPLNTITASGAAAALVTSNLVKLRGTSTALASDEPLHTVSAQGTHFSEVRAFLTAYYGTDQDPKLCDPLHTVTTRDRYALVTVRGQQYAISDIGLRMLAPRELFTAQGFPLDYIIEYGITPDGKRKQLTKTAQVRMCGNSVSPYLAEALVRANLGEMAIRRAA